MVDIQITGFALDNYLGSGSAAYLQVVIESDWTDADGDSHGASSYDEVALAVNTATHRIDETTFNLTPTQTAFAGLCLSLSLVQRRRIPQLCDLAEVRRPAVQ